jgi:type I restriction enzyme S subunit
MTGSALVETKSLHVPAAYGEPPDGWTWSRLDDVSEGVFDCPHSTPKLTATGPFVVRTQDIITGVFRADQAGHVSEETYAERIARVTPSRGDLLYSREGTYFGIAAEIPAKTRVCLGQRMVLIRPDKRRLDFSFLCHWLNSPIMAAHIHGYRDGTVAERLNLPTIRALPILIPPLAEQKAIAAVLGALDDKIELNRRMNATLEAMARALFQSWFVDFDPVRAKLDGRPPAALDPATAALFPEHLEETALGHTPIGWEVRSLDKTAHYLNGLALQKYPPGDDPTLPVIKIAQLRKGDSVGADLCNTDLPPNYIVQDGDVLFSWSGSLEVELWCGGPGALNQHLFKVTSPEFPKWFYYLWTLYHLDEFRLIAADKATTMGHIQRGHLTAAKVLIPPRPLLDAMTRTMSPLIDQLVANRIQSRTLATLRDALLPKLLSGELSVDHLMATAKEAM